MVEVCRRVGITEQTFYRWRKQYEGLEVDQVRQLKQLQEENGKLKKLVAELSLDKVMLEDVLSKKLQSHRAAALWFVICRACTEWVSAAPVGCRAFRCQAFGTRARRNRGPRFGCGFGKSHKSGSATDTGRSGCC